MTMEGRGTLEFRDVLQATRRMYRNHWASMTLVTGVGMILLWLGVLEWPAGSVISTPFFAAGLLLSTRYWTSSYWFARRQWKKNPNLQGPIQIAMDEEGCCFQTVNERSELKWAAFLKWQEEKDVFLLYTSPVIAQIVPKRFFVSREQAVRSLIASKIVRG